MAVFVDPYRWNYAYDSKNLVDYSFIHSTDIVAVEKYPHLTVGMGRVAFAVHSNNAEFAVSCTELTTCRINYCENPIKWRVAYKNALYGSLYICDECYAIIRKIPITECHTHAMAQYTNTCNGRTFNYLCYSYPTGYITPCMQIIPISVHWWPYACRQQSRGCSICNYGCDCNCLQLSKQIFISVMAPKYLLTQFMFADCADVALCVMGKIILGA